MARVDLRKLKEQALKAIEKKQYAKAAELYLQISAAEPNDPDWHQRAGEAWRKVPDGPRAAAELTLAAEGYAKGGFLLKAIAVCKVVQQIDPRHTATQAMLAELYATREGKPAPSKAVVAPKLDLTRKATGEFELAPSRRAGDVPIAIDELARRPAPPLLTIDDVSAAGLGLSADKSTLVDLDQRPAPTLLPPSAPLETLPLHAFIGGHKSDQFNLETIMPEETAPAAYEIELDEADLELAEAIPIDEPEPAPPPNLHKLPQADRESDFSDLMSEPPPPPNAGRLAQLPKIPLFSSLAADDLRHLIEQVLMRELEPGETIMRQGESGASLFVIVSGGVEVALDGPPPRTLATLGEGAFFGELGLITNFPRSATVRAREPTQLLEISRELVLDIVARSPDVLKTLLRFFRDRLLDRLLGESPLFASLPPEEARRLADRFVFLELEPGVRAVAEGERSPGLFLLLCGEVEAVRDGAVLAALGPGDVFGEISLLEHKPATASIVTRTKCWALELPRSRFQEIIVTYPQLLEYVSSLAERRKQAGPEERVEFL
jgi:CRP-like cAMP-binding protein